MRAHCLDCHGATDEKKGNLDLRQVRLMERGGDSGAAIEKGNSASSLLIEKVVAGEMPPGNVKVSPAELEKLKAWLEQGAKTARPEPENIGKGLGIAEEERAYWAFQPLVYPTMPEAKSPRSRNEIDALIYARLQAKGLDFSPEASRRALIFRAYFDLVGLPPTKAQVDEFVSDTDPLAYEKLIDKLLESPHYGERWGRHWLDVAGYSDSEGFTTADRPRPWAFRYRDYVIRSFNNDKPFNEFIVEQLAGDELVPPPHQNLSAEQQEKLIATGYLRMAANGTGDGSVDQDLAKNQNVADTLKIVSSGLLGFSVACAQCHDHRYDPISHRDYYRLRAIFEPALNWKSWKTPDQTLISLYTTDDIAKAQAVEAEAQQVSQEREKKQAEYIAAALEKELQKFAEPMRASLKMALDTPADKRTPEQQELLKSNPSVEISPGVLYQYDAAAAEELKKYDGRIAEIRAKKPREEFLSAVIEPTGNPPQTFVFHRGDHRQPTEEVKPGDLEIFGGLDDLPTTPSPSGSTGRRLAFAKHLTNGTHPGFGRVIVNRIWLHHFGRAIVGTPGEFGRLGDQPTHPELLDLLALEFAKNQWSLKKLHRYIMLSTAYRQDSMPRQDGLDKDLENGLYWRYPIRRLEAEAIRDRVLSVSNQLKPDAFGPAVPVKLDDAGQVLLSADDRRSVYSETRRSQPVAMLQSFDQPVLETNCERRISSTVATQSLLLLNSEFILTHANHVANLVAEEGKQIVDERIAEVTLDFVPAQNPWTFGVFEMGSEVMDTKFTPLPGWNGHTWGGGTTLPNETFGWASLHASGGHPDSRYAVVRRLNVPLSGTITITGQVGHGSPNGNGVRARVVSSRKGELGSWEVFNKSLPANVEKLEVEPGDTVDFVVDTLGDTNSDSFSWETQVDLKDGAGNLLVTWKSKEGFHGPPPADLRKQIVACFERVLGRSPTSEELQNSATFVGQQVQLMSANGQSVAEKQAIVNLCQILLTCNEFLYID